jgi:hypothetical protein
MWQVNAHMLPWDLIIVMSIFLKLQIIQCNMSSSKKTKKYFTKNVLIN